MKLEKIIKIWNDAVDDLNQWEELGEDEKVEFAFQLGVIKQNDFIPFDPTKEKPEDIPKLTHVVGFSGIPEDGMKREVIVGLYDNGVYKLVIHSYLAGKDPMTTSIGLTRFGCEIVKKTLEEALDNIESHKI